MTILIIVIISNYIKKILFQLIIVIFAFFLFTNPAYAASTNNINLVYQQCKDKYQNDPEYAKYYKDFFYAQYADSSGTLSKADCPASFSDIQYLVVRIIVIIITIFGIVVFFNLVKGSILYATAGPNKDKIKAARGTIQNTFAGLAIILLAYTLIVFISVRLGLGNDGSYSILDGGRIIFRFIFVY